MCYSKHGFQKTRCCGAPSTSARSLWARANPLSVRQCRGACRDAWLRFFSPHLGHANLADANRAPYRRRASTISMSQSSRYRGSPLFHVTALRTPPAVALPSVSTPGRPHNDTPGRARRQSSNSRQAKLNLVDDLTTPLGPTSSDSPGQRSLHC